MIKYRLPFIAAIATRYVVVIRRSVQRVGYNWQVVKAIEMMEESGCLMDEHNYTIFLFLTKSCRLHYEVITKHRVRPHCLLDHLV